ncbi:MAG: FRG domain-containing protein [Fimbriimonadaceae bacterium]|nr:FRG domain-containing protein [Fimbriimonadaceae bacterium]
MSISRWNWYYDTVINRVEDTAAYVFRGHRRQEWPLESTLDRRLRDASDDERQTKMAQHLQRFQRAARGRRGPYARPIENDAEWWALGQHYGLWTPLLDWTSSPFIAAFFAYSVDQESQPPKDYRRAVWALNQQSVETATVPAGVGSMEFVDPLTDDNARLVAQGGLFTFLKGPGPRTVEEWVRAVFKGATEPVLIKLTVPETDRTDALRSLNRMSINAATVYPDLQGTSLYANQALADPAYGRTTDA